MFKQDPIFTAMQFNQCINEQNLKQLSDLMTDNHKLICYGNVDTEDKKTSMSAWKNFFRLYPDYRNHFNKVVLNNDFVSIAGFSSCTDENLNGPALWSAKIEENLISEWQVYEDNRKKLGLI
ncbi:MAG: hypothetical protein ACP5FK_11490 [bacterium]